MNPKRILLPLLILCGSAGLVAADPIPGAPRDIAITANDTLKFSQTEIDAQQGETLHVQLKNEGTVPKAVMGHNWILLKDGDDPSAYATAALSAKDDNYQPKALADQVLAAIPLLGPEETGDVTFTLPATPGTYAYLCTFPGHFQAGMTGKIIVK
jgi:azurin